MKKTLLLFLSSLLFLFSNGQKINEATALKLVTEKAKEIGISRQQISNSFVSDAYFNTISGTQMVYLQQGYKNTPLYNSLKVLAFKNNELVSSAGEYIAGLEKLVTPKSGLATLLPANAVLKAFADIKLSAPKIGFSQTKLNGRKYNFGILEGVNEEVLVERLWVPVFNNKGNVEAVKLAWVVQVVPVKSADWWMIQVDAQNGKIIGKNNLTIYEGQHNFNEDIINVEKIEKPEKDFFSITALQKNTSNNPSLVNTVNYLVIPYPAESPIHNGGTPAVRTNPWTNAPGNATSLGWHNNGSTDYTISRGNNVWATEDRAGTNGSTIITPNGIPATSTTSPDPLNFQFAPNFSLDPTSPNYQQFAITNLFYWNNIIHDITYQYGFTEPAGNFQANNQGRGGAQNDYVIAIAQSSTGTNNANFATPADGSRPRMRMYLFDGPANVHVNAPGSIAGDYAAVEGNFSTANQLLNVGPVTAGVVYYDDAAGTAHEACNGAPVNSITGKIVLINRGNCNFTVKILNAQNAQAAGVIMINNVPDAPIIMGGTDNTITIPAVMVSQATGALLIAQLGNGLNATLSRKRVDGDLDNGIVSHEFFHGVSNRLTGGPAQSGCLANAEQGGEGWSDYFALMVTTNWATASLTDGSIPRPIANYAVSLPTTGSGIRNYPYSTDIAVNPLTYANMGVNPIGTESHNIGEIWCAALWEMTWGIIQQTGNINSNLFDASSTAGNSVALKLVIEGMKLQPCVPGFIDARNAIIKADSLIYNGAYKCAIWTAFAKRGMGYGAIQGSSNSATDHVASSALPPAASISTQPADASTCEGSNVNFSIATTGLVSNYQWQVSTDGGTTWNNVSPVVNAATPTLNTVKLAMNNNKYRVIVNGGCPNNPVTSSVVTLTVSSSNLSVVTQPSSTSACVGGTASFTVAANSGSVTYNWQVSTDAGATWNSLSPTVTTATLTLTNVTAAMNNYQYRAVISSSGGSCGSSSINTNAAMLTVGANSVSVTTQPVNAAACTGNNASFNITASGASLTYNWQVSTDGRTTWSNLSPAVTTATLTLNNVTAAMTNYQYQVIVTGSGSCGNSVTSATATLSVTGPASISAQPANATICEGGSNNFCVTGQGAGLSYQWQLSTTGCGGTFTDIAGATSGCFNVTNATLGMNNYAYRVIVTGACAPSVTSACVVLTVNSAPVFTSQPNAVTTCAGTDATFSVTASGTNIAYNWQVSTDGGATWNNLSPAVTTATLTLSNVAAAMNNNQYRVQMTGSGTCTTPVISNAVTLAVNAAPSVTASPTDANVCDGADVSFTGTATGNGLSYQWQQSTTGCGGTFTDIAGATSLNYNITGVTVALEGYAYRLVISGTCSPAAISNCAKLHVIVPANITAHPADAAVCETGDASFTVAASGDGIIYQWQVSADGGTTFADIAGETGTSLTVSSATIAQHQNKYRAVVSNCSSNSTISNAATLTVNANPVINISLLPNASSPASIEVTSIVPAGTYSYVWYSNTQLIPGQTGPVIPLASNPGISGDINVVATNSVNGCTSSSNLLTVQRGKSDVLVVYTNPNNGNFDVMYNETNFVSGKRYINVYDAKGAKVFSKVYDITLPYQRMKINMGAAANGVYSLELLKKDNSRLGAVKIFVHH
ncbi:MAG: M36 family metallopeptidase [Chitinophagaceae bacterium]|nr:M36 family metallopeptidase [Chitinophagaceae bacterium]